MFFLEKINAFHVLKNKIKMLRQKFEIDELTTVKAWIIGSKTRIEDEFFTQLVYREKHKQKLWDAFSKSNTQFYIMEIELPLYIKKDVTPF